MTNATTVRTSSQVPQGVEGRQALLAMVGICLVVLLAARKPKSHW